MSSEYTQVLQLLLSALLGAAIGIQRESLGSAAGFRTHVLVSSAATHPPDPRGEEKPVVVKEDKYTNVTMLYDSGIR